MPKFFQNWLLNLSPSQRDEMWSWADGDPNLAEEIIERIGRPDGKSNAESVVHG